MTQPQPSSTTDIITGLHGRALLYGQLARARERHATTQEHFAYLLCDVDDVEAISARLGQEQVDNLVREVAVRLTDAVAPSEYVARVAAARFAVLARDTNALRAAWLMRSIGEVIEGLVDLGGASAWPSVTIGAASTTDVPAHAVDLAALSALKQARRAGRGRAVLFDPSTAYDDSTEREMAGGLALRYRPVVRLATNQVVGAEALVRLNQSGPEEAWLTPHAELLGGIDELGSWALRRACADATRWPARLTVSVNVSHRQLNDDLVGIVGEALRSSGLEPERLWLEVTEPAVSNAYGASSMFDELVGMGVKICLDDFGAGTRAMASLRELPLHMVKVDRTFVGNIARSADDTGVAATTIKLAASLRRPIVAQGVETVQQLHLAHRLGCEYGQGSFWSSAVHAAELAGTANEIELRVVDSATSYEPPPEVREPGSAARMFIVGMHLRGASPASIAAALNQDGITPPTGSRWRQGTVARLIAQWPDPDF